MKKILFVLSIAFLKGQVVNSNLITVLPNTNSTGAPSSVGSLVLRDISVPAKTVTITAPNTIGTSYSWSLPTADSAGCISSNGSGTLSIIACGGTTYWSLVTSGCGINPSCLQPVGAYDIIPPVTNSEDMGSSSRNWFHTYTEFLLAQVVDVGNLVTTYSTGLGTDPGGHTNALIKEILPSTSLMSWDAAGNYSYVNFLPSSNNTLALGASGDRWEGYFDNININSCTGCAPTYWSLQSSGCGINPNCLQPISSYDIIPPATNAEDMGSSSRNWFHTYTEFLLAQVVDVGNLSTDYSFGLSGTHLRLTLLGSANPVFDFNNGVSYQWWGDISPAIASTYNLGTSGLPWNTGNINTLTLNTALAGTFNMSGNMIVTGNFYNRIFAGTPSCAGVADGWMGYDTSSNTLWICDGGVAKAH